MSPYAPPVHFHKHDGFFLRFGLGVGYFSSSGTISNSGFADTKYTVKGGGLAFDISIGGAISPGLILAASLAVTSGNNATWHEDGVPDFSSGAGVSALGVTLDYYPDPREGFHFGGALSLAGVNYRDAGTGNDDSRQGWGLSGHAGYEWWVANDWSIGFMGRLTYARATRRIDTTVGTSTFSASVTDSVVSPALLFVATYN